MSDLDARARAILDVWFGPEDDPGYEAPRERWFARRDDFDALLRQRFSRDVHEAQLGHFVAMRDAPKTCLALVLLLDQFPRNLYRGDARSFASDPEALAVARDAVARGHDQRVPPVHRWFFYLPFEHSERLDDQERAVALFDALGEGHEVAQRAAREHRDVIARFGRFPHRNAILRRASTPDEEAYLAAGGPTFAR